VSDKDAIDELTDCPNTPTHITTPVSDQDAFNEILAGSPSTPSHISASASNQDVVEQPSVDHSIAPALAAVISPAPHDLFPDGFPQGFKVPDDSDDSDGSDFLDDDAESEIEQDSLDSEKQIILESEMMDVVNTNEEIKLASGTTEKTTFVDYSIQEKISASSSVTFTRNINFATSIGLAPKLPPPVSAVPSSPVKSALRSPLKNGAKTPKKTVTWDPEFQSDDIEVNIDDDFALEGLRILVDISSNGKDISASVYYSSGLEDLGARTFEEWPETGALTHVVFKEGSRETIDKVIASKGAVKCVKPDWVDEVILSKKCVDETKYLVDLSTVEASTPVPKTPKRFDFFTPAKTPTRFLQKIESSSATKSRENTPSTPSSAAFDRTPTFMEDKENYCDDGIADQLSMTGPRKKVPPPMKTPTKESLLSRPPIKRPLFDSTTASSSKAAVAKRPFFDPTPASLSKVAVAKPPFFDKTPTKSPFLSQAPIKGPFLSQAPSKSPFFGQGPSKSPFSTQTPTQNPFLSQTPARSPFFGQPPTQSSQTPLAQDFINSAAPPRTPGRFSKLWASSGYSSEQFKKKYAEMTGSSLNQPAKKPRGN
jgi:hypothetical protein